MLRLMRTQRARAAARALHRTSGTPASRSKRAANTQNDDDVVAPNYFARRRADAESAHREFRSMMRHQAKEHQDQINKRAQQAQNEAMQQQQQTSHSEEDDASIVVRDPWHPQRLEPVLVRMQQTLLSNTNDIRLKLSNAKSGNESALLNPYLFLLQQAESRGAALATFMCIFDSAQRTAAMLAQSSGLEVRVSTAAYNIVLSACSRFENFTLGSRLCARALELRRRGVAVHHIVQSMFAEGRHRAALDMSLDALQFYCSSANQSNKNSMWHFAQHAPAAYFSIALQSAMQLRDWSRLSQIVQLPNILDLILTTDTSSAPPNDIPLTATQARLQSQEAVLSLIQVMSHLSATLTAQSAFSITAALPSSHQTVLDNVRSLLNTAAGSSSDTDLDVAALGKAIFAHQSWDLQDQVAASILSGRLSALDFAYQSRVCNDSSDNIHHNAHLSAAHIRSTRQLHAKAFQSIFESVLSHTDAAGEKFFVAALSFVRAPASLRLCTDALKSTALSNSAAVNTKLAQAMVECRQFDAVSSVKARVDTAMSVLHTGVGPMHEQAKQSAASRSKKTQEDDGTGDVAWNHQERSPRMALHNAAIAALLQRKEAAKALALLDDIINNDDCAPDAQTFELFFLHSSSDAAASAASAAEVDSVKPIFSAAMEVWQHMSSEQRPGESTTVPPVSASNLPSLLSSVQRSQVFQVGQSPEPAPTIEGSLQLHPTTACLEHYLHLLAAMATPIISKDVSAKAPVYMRTCVQRHQQRQLDQAASDSRFSNFSSTIPGPAKLAAAQIADARRQLGAVLKAAQEAMHPHYLAAHGLELTPAMVASFIRLCSRAVSVALPFEPNAADRQDEYVQALNDSTVDMFWSALPNGSADITIKSLRIVVQSALSNLIGPNSSSADSQLFKSSAKHSLLAASVVEFCVSISNFTSKTGGLSEADSIFYQDTVRHLMSTASVSSNQILHPTPLVTAALSLLLPKAARQLDSAATPNKRDAMDALHKHIIQTFVNAFKSTNKHSVLPPGDALVAELIYTFASSGNIETAWHLWRDLLPALHYSPSVQSLQAMVVAAADAGYMEDAEELCAVLRTLLQQQLLDNEPQLSKQVASNNVLDLSSLKNDIPLPNASGFAAVQKEVDAALVRVEKQRITLAKAEQRALQTEAAKSTPIAPSTFQDALVDSPDNLSISSSSLVDAARGIVSEPKPVAKAPASIATSNVVPLFAELIDTPVQWKSGDFPTPKEFDALELRSSLPLSAPVYSSMILGHIDACLNETDSTSAANVSGMSPIFKWNDSVTSTSSRQLLRLWIDECIGHAKRDACLRASNIVPIHDRMSAALGQQCVWGGFTPSFYAQLLSALAASSVDKQLNQSYFHSEFMRLLQHMHSVGAFASLGEPRQENMAVLQVLLDIDVALNRLQDAHALATRMLALVSKGCTLRHRDLQPLLMAYAHRGDSSAIVALLRGAESVLSVRQLPQTMLDALLSELRRTKNEVGAEELASLRADAVREADRRTTFGTTYRDQ